MYHRFRWLSLVVGCSAALAAASARAGGAGQEDLDKATEAKLTAASIDDLGEVIRLAESAMAKGLDESSAEFAKRLLASTLLERAQANAKLLLSGTSSVEEFRKRREAALADVEKSLQNDPKQAQAFLLSAQLNLLPGGKNAKEVLALLDKAVEFGADDADAKVKALILRAALREKPEDKRADLDEAVRLMPDNAAVVRARGLALADMDKPEEALADLTRAAQLEPDSGPTQEARAIVLARLKRFDEALAALDKARELNPNSLAPLMQRAKVHSEQKKFDEALDDVNKALEMDPGNVVLLLFRAGVHQEKGDKQKALADTISRASAAASPPPPSGCFRCPARPSRRCWRCPRPPRRSHFSTACASGLTRRSRNWKNSPSSIRKTRSPCSNWACSRAPPRSRPAPSKPTPPSWRWCPRSGGPGADAPTPI